MKNKLKKLGVLAVLLANVTIFAPQKVEGQGKITIVVDENPTSNNRRYIDITIGFVNIYGCIDQAGDCLATIVIGG
ncbi:hypothetical protein [Raineya orbicola]|jgi:hypothetical protein|uniref:Uncharacterized protein n=1 Tax=Raineya orbicola TaxID=2016530 RepID=A0A2N3I9G0_9BACT|nr:hypothetical protein [Raineya orbicola]PKQ66898.1 hypothetical protein Rain11_2239 [Raineya orbicola]